MKYSPPKLERLFSTVSYDLIEELEAMSKKVVETTVERLEAKMDAVNTKYNVLIWAIGFAGLIISLAIIFGNKIGN